MKIFFDTNVHVADALLGQGASRILRATRRARWRMFSSRYVIEELQRVLVEDLEFPPRLARLAQHRVMTQCTLVTPPSTKARVSSDPNDSPILQAALACGADYLVTNDRHLLSLDPFESLRIISMRRYHALLEEQGLIK
jgi:putative PIN family toxin of toxin-antitoxin system